MSTTSSANATALPDRRRILSTLAAAGALGLPALPSLGAEIGGADAHLFELGSQWEDAKALADETNRRLVEVSAVYDRAWPDVTPEPLFVRPDDDLALRTRPEKVKGKPTGRHIYGLGDIDTAEEALAGLADHELPFGDNPQARAKLARLREIVKARHAEREGRRAAWLSYGMEEAESASSAAEARCRELRWQIVQCPATTLSGVLLKTRIVADCFGGTMEEIETVFDEAIGDASGETMALSIARDLIMISGRTGGLHA